jgi:uncharacterized membrane protein
VATIGERRDVTARSEGSTRRLEALADGFFAIVMTLLVLDLSTGEAGESVTAVLRGEATHLLLYFDSLLALGVLWFGNRNAFTFVHRTDHPHTWLNLAMLGFVGLVPWTTSLAAQHLHDPLAVSVYTANLVVITLLDAVTWLYATGRGNLATGLSEGARQVSRRLVFLPVVGFTIALGLAWVNTWAALALDAVLPLLPVLGVTYRLQYRLSRAH